MRMRLSIALAALGALLVPPPLPANDPPAGSLLLPLLGAPVPAGSGASATYLDAPWADRLNPAASAGQQRPVLDLGLGLLTDFGGQGFGGALSFGLDLPRPYGVWNAGLSLVGTPASMSELPLGFLFQARGGIAKDLLPNLYLGAALEGSLGSSAGFGWGLALDLGLIHKLGDLGPLKDLRWGAVLSGLGKGYATPLSAKAWIPPYTLSAGARTLLLRTEDLKAGLGLDLSFPSFADLGLGLSGSLSYRDRVTLRLGWGFPSLGEVLGATGARKSLLPSLSLMGSIPLGRPKEGSLFAKLGWDRSELRPSLAVQPLYGSLWQLGTGLTLPLGVVDNRGPDIRADFPTSPWGPCYLSPNADGKADSLEVPVTITDQRYIASYVMTITPADAPPGAPPLRSIANKESRPETQGLGGFWSLLTYVKKGVPVPAKLTWNGFGEGGEVAPDGAYVVRIAALDDNGNRSEAGPFDLVVDDSPPRAELAPAASPVFSPDGDGSKDTITIKMSGSAEDLWTLRVLDASGSAVRTFESKEAAPSDTVWDGKNEGGAVVADGVYALVLSATDRAGNSFSKRLDNIVVNTQQPPVGLSIDDAAFSPNGDGVKDSLGIRPSVPVRTGLVAWRLAVIDKDRAEVASLGSKDPAALPERWAFDGRGAEGKTFPEGSYQARLTATYLNGFSPSILSPTFILDLTAPAAKVGADRTAFNPAGSEAQARVTLSQEGGEEELWTGEILGADGKARRTWTWKGRPEAKLVWDGTDDAGALLPDGLWTYRLRSADRAGNAFVSPPLALALDTERKTARLVADLRAFSPNGDGVKDTLSLSGSVTAPERLQSWKLGIFALPAAADGTGGTPDRTKPLRTWTGTANPPASFSWNGTKDDGTKAPEGRYLALLELAWPNGDRVEAQALPVLLDTQAPSISVSADHLLFSPNEESAIREVRISQKSVPGDDWEGRLYDSSNAPVRSWTWKDHAADLVWDATDSAGNLVRDGSYRYEVSSTDAAGNSTKAVIPAIGVDARRPQVSVTASSTGFSPNGDGQRDTISFSLDVTVKDGISAWNLGYLDEGGTEVAGISGKGGDLPQRAVWDGKNREGKIVEGSYRARLSLSYLNGNRPSAQSPLFVIDNKPPTASVKADRAAFNPAGVPAQARVILSQEGSEEELWTGEVLGADGKARRTWTWKGRPEASLAWDGSDDAGALLPDGAWTYRLRSTDRAGNAFVSPPLPLALDTERKSARLASDLGAFSPNSDGVKDALALSDSVTAPERLASWKLGLYPATEAGKILDRAKPSRTWTGVSKLPPSFSWNGARDDGTKAAEGRYLALLELAWPNGDALDAQSLPIFLDTTAPSITLAADPLLFSTNENSRLRSTAVSQKSVPGDDWEGRLYDSSGALVRSWSWKGQAAGFSWDATDAAGNLVKDGAYRYEVASTDAAGNSTKASIPSIVVDSRPSQAFVAASAQGLSPNGDGRLDDVSFDLIVTLREGIASWRFSLRDPSGAEGASFAGTGESPPSKLVWDGKTSGGKVVEGVWTGVFTVDYAKGDHVEARTGSIVVDVTPPKVDLAIKPEFFSPDNDGVDDELSISLSVKDASELADWKLEIFEVAVEEAPGAAPKERSFAGWSGAGAPASVITWDGRSSKGELVESATDYPLVFAISDIWGNRDELRGTVAVDVLVIREGDRLKIKVPSIVFRANFADFDGLDADTVAKNKKVIARIAEILNKFKDYRIAIEGHANSIGKIYGYTAAKIADEERLELLPLSTNRAELVRKMLAAGGVDARRLSVVGRGSSDPVVDFKDAVNRWKNRRVEFILIKTAAPPAGSGG